MYLQTAKILQQEREQVSERGKVNAAQQFAISLDAIRELTCHNYGITQCHLAFGGGDIPALTPAEAGTRFSDPKRDARLS